MPSNQISRLAGMRDISGEALRQLRVAGERVSVYLSAGGYRVIDTPMLEEAELFVRKSGGELTSRLYSFADPGGRRVSLRPEFTSSVIRHFVQEGDSLAPPVRLQYGGPVFRYEPDTEGAYREYTQVGAELIGEGGVDADAELLGLAWEGLRETGLRSYGMRIGHIGVLRDLLKSYGLSERASLFIVGNAQALKVAGADVAGLMDQAREIGLLGASVKLVQNENGAAEDATRDLIQHILGEAMSSPSGRRDPDQIVERLLRKMRQGDDPDRIEGAIGMVRDLAQAEGRPEDALAAARTIASDHGLQTSAFDELAELFESLAARGIGDEQVTLDLGYARGISYYTGVIFGLISTGPSAGALLGGGGRYDGLVRALGGGDVPALGFAYELDRVVEAIAREDPAVRSTSTSPSSPER